MNEIRHALKVERRKRYLENLIKEAVLNVLAEQEQSQAPVATPPTPVAQVPQQSQAPALQPDASGTVKPEEEFTVDDLIERLNIIRAGRSFTDPEVYGRLVTFFKTLSDQQKMDLQNILISLGKIVIDVEEAPVAAQEPVPPPAPPPPPPVQTMAPPAATSAASSAPVSATPVV